MKIYIGIDPGKSGAIAFVPETGKPWTVKCSETDKDISDAFLEIEHEELYACIEKVGPGVFGAGKMGSKSAFTFGASFGGLLMLLTCHGVRFNRVLPRTWQTAMQCMTGGDKNVSKRRAQELFQEIKITHAIADALLIAEYARRTNLRSTTQQIRRHGRAQTDQLKTQSKRPLKRAS